ncbi:MAG: FAD-dependent oxidoreductase [Proteobacteria bacterium]|nr:FAD-dependent oxidoreductase [Pseudomonadota bacterium]MBU1582477.1 FAD-dependent oxidoreductase [Pseudomonadota bacterium]MBU2454898.1 FAD-dependent oxidoreductase [Pseudomonadota bacterium]MBU2630623.1 FAD-dependent oxidoreductase [Pseudomonadota bacterium]
MNERYDFSQALAEADRCLLCHDAPCSKGCPANTDPGKFIKKFKMKNIKGAIRTIKENNILGGACGILCPTARLCEKECSCTHLDRPIQIGKLQEFLVGHGRKIGFQVFEKPEAVHEKVAIIGSGPAGLSCGAELAKKGYQVTIFEKMGEPGGVLRYGVPSYRFSKDYLKEELEDIFHLGVEVECNHPITREGEAQELLNKGFNAVFIATGLWDAARLFDEKPKGVYNSVAFLSSPHTGQQDIVKEQIKDKKVAVIGGGSVAMDCAGYAVTLGASDVYLIYRRSFDQMPAEKDERIETLEKNIHFLILNQPKGYVTNSNGAVTGIKLVRTQLEPAKDAQRRMPVEIKDSDWTLDIDFVVEAIGNKAFDDSNRVYPEVDVDGKKLIKASLNTCQTSKPGIFAGGDIVRGPSLVVHAVQDGKTAAQTIDSYLTHRRG